MQLDYNKLRQSVTLKENLAVFSASMASRVATTL
jgi:hypothetical protein